ncbi:MAG: hypothetical protein L7U87_05890 [Chlamydiales bacterium]|nr:hypothetical protein [Chlamydiales bacterium]
MTIRDHLVEPSVVSTGTAFLSASKGRKKEGTCGGHSFKKIESNKALFFDDSEGAFKVLSGIKSLISTKSDHKKAFYHLRVELQNLYGDGVLRASWKIMQLRDGVDLALMHQQGDQLLVKDYQKIHSVAREVYSRYEDVESLFLSVRGRVLLSDGVEHLRKVQQQLPEEVIKRLQEVPSLNSLTAIDLEVLLTYASWGRLLSREHGHSVGVAGGEALPIYDTPEVTLDFS